MESREENRECREGLRSARERGAQVTREDVRKENKQFCEVK